MSRVSKLIRRDHGGSVFCVMLRQEEVEIVRKCLGLLSHELYAAELERPPHFSASIDYDLTEKEVWAFYGALRAVHFSMSKGNKKRHWEV